MIIAIPVNESSFEGGICANFGRAPYFLIHDSETGTNQFLENEAVKSRDGAGVRASQAIADAGTQVLLTPRCGGNAAFILQTAKIDIFLTKGDSIKDNLTAFARGELQKLGETDLERRGYGK